MSAKFPRGKFDLIYADPPWEYENRAASKGQWGGAAMHYPTMPLAEIAALPVRNIAADDCLLAMWWVAPMPDDALALLSEWGFRLVTMKGFTWHKVTKHGKDHFGLGTWTRANSEDCLLAVRGKPRRASASVRQMIHAPIRAHSRKPDEARDLLVELCGDVRRIELFARQRHRGWKAWGNEV